MKRQVTAHRSAKLSTHFILIFGAVFMVGPFIWMILTSFKTMAEATNVPLIIFPKSFNFDNFNKVLSITPFVTNFINTVIVTVTKVSGQLLLCSAAAYAFARINFPGRNLLFVLCLSVLMVPGQVFLLPQFLIMKDFGWLNTLKAIIAPGLFSSFGLFLLRQFFMTLPRELDEAAKIDGCNHFQIYWKILLPLVVPGMVALAIFTGLASWNDLLWPMIVNSSPEKMTLSVGLSLLQGQHGTDFPALMAGALLASLPMLILFIFLQKYFIEGISMTGIK